MATTSRDMTDKELKYYGLTKFDETKEASPNQPIKNKFAVDPIDYKFDEDVYVKEIKDYIDATYGQHYSREKFQAVEFIFDGGHGAGFNIGNMLKYTQRYGKKGTKDDARKDLVKVIHYAILQLHIHDTE